MPSPGRKTHHWASNAALRVALGAAALAGAEGLPAAPGTAAGAASLEVKVGGLTADGRLPPSAAYCPPTKMDPAEYNISPSVAWSRGPRATRSYALIMTDLDVPKDLSLINKPGVTISADTPRVPFIHWVLVDIPPSITALKEGAEGDGFVPKGKPSGRRRMDCAAPTSFHTFIPRTPNLPVPAAVMTAPAPRTTTSCRIATSPGCTPWMYPPSDCAACSSERMRSVPCRGTYWPWARRRPNTQRIREALRPCSKTVARTVDFPALFAAQKRPLPHTEIARPLDIPRSSCQDVLRTLSERGCLYE
jgi:phosphatidylethanolamine-binding protein (PEBP) family uncharacterized protein